MYPSELTSIHLQSLNETATFAIPTLTAILEVSSENAAAESEHEIPASSDDQTTTIVSPIAVSESTPSLAVQLAPVRIAPLCLSTPREQYMIQAPTLRLVDVRRPRHKKAQTCKICGERADQCPSIVNHFSIIPVNIFIRCQKPWKRAVCNDCS